MVAPVGRFKHAQYGLLNFTRERLAEMQRNFDQRVRHIDIALDVDHDQGAATGWLEQLQFREADAATQTPAGLWALVRWTPKGAELLKDEIYRYFSPEFGPWDDPETGEHFDNVLCGGALTNRPFLKTMPNVQLSEREAAATLLRLYDAAGRSAIRLAEVSTKSWASVAKAKLPASCFLIVGDPAKKATWKLPVYEGAGEIGADGMYTKRGPLNVHAVRAALDAIGGARSGSPMTGVSADIKARLERWIQRYGSSGNGGNKAANSNGKTGKQRAAASEGGFVKKDLSKNRQLDETELEDDDNDELFALDEQDDDDTNDDTFELDERGEEGGEAALDEADGDGPDEGEDGKGNGFDAESDTHGAMTTDAHSHGKYGAHSHDGNADHSEAPLKRGRKQASEPKQHQHGREQQHRGGETERVRLTELEREVKRLREENARNSYALYETQVDKTLDGWKTQSFQFREGTRTDKDGKRVPVMKNGKIAMSRAFSEAYRGFMLGAGIRLREADRAKVNEIIEMALSTAIVDLSQRGSSFDQESRRTVRNGGGRGDDGGNNDDVKLQEIAERMALSEHNKPLTALDAAQQFDIYARAERAL